MTALETIYAHPWLTTLWLFLIIASLPTIVRSLLDPLFLRFEKRVAVAAKKLEAKEEQLTNVIAAMEDVIRMAVSAKEKP